MAGSPKLPPAGDALVTPLLFDNQGRPEQNDKRRPYSSTQRIAPQLLAQISQQSVPHKRTADGNPALPTHGVAAYLARTKIADRAPGAYQGTAPRIDDAPQPFAYRCAGTNRSSPAHTKASKVPRLRKTFCNGSNPDRKKLNRPRSKTKTPRFLKRPRRQAPPSPPCRPVCRRRRLSLIVRMITPTIGRQDCLTFKRHVSPVRAASPPVLCQA